MINLDILRSDKYSIQLWQWLLFAGFVLFIKSLVFFLDPLPMFFLGDSHAYIGTALLGWIPHDRSFVYGYIIRYLTVNTHSLTTLVAFQALLSGITAMMVAYILIRFFTIQKKLSFISGIFCAIEPLQLFYERYVLTEAISLFIFAVFIVCVFHYLKRPRLILLVAIQAVGIALISLRLSFLPIVAIMTCIIPMLGLPVFKRNFPMARSLSVKSSANLSPTRHMMAMVMLHLICSIGFMAVFHWGYQQLYSHLTGGPPAYQYRSGMFLLADWGPVVKLEDFPSPQLGEAVLGNLQFDLRDRQTRGPHRWLEGGLIANLNKALPDPLEADQVAKTTAINALKRDPAGIAVLAFRGFADYWDRDQMAKSMVIDRGSDRNLPPDLLKELQDHFHLAAAELPFLKTITNSYYFMAWPWYLVLLCTPIIAITTMCVCRWEHWRYLVILLISSAGVVAVASVLIERPTIRYLHSLGWLNCLLCGIFFNLLISKFQVDKSSNSPT